MNRIPPASLMSLLLGFVSFTPSVSAGAEQCALTAFKQSHSDAGSSDEAISLALASCWKEHEQQVVHYQYQLQKAGIRPSDYTYSLAWAYTTNRTLTLLNKTLLSHKAV